MVSETFLVDICDSVGDKYRFGFNGMEKVNEWAGIGNFVEFSERGYDTRIARFLMLDPYKEKFPYLTPYQFASNSPIAAIDLEGLEAVVVMTGEIGEWRKASNGELGQYAMYKVNVYENMTIAEYNKAKGTNTLRTPDATFLLSRDAWNKSGNPRRSTKRYGSLNEVPPGEYFMKYYKNGYGKKLYHIVISDEPGGDIINGPDGYRDGIRWHHHDPCGSDGCSTTGSGKDKQPVFDIVDKIPSLREGKEVKVIYEEREAEYDKKNKIWRGTENSTDSKKTNTKNRPTYRFNNSERKNKFEKNVEKMNKSGSGFSYPIPN